MSQRYVRLEQLAGPSWGLVDGDNIRLLAGDCPFGRYQVTEETVPLKDAKLLAPATPGKILAVGLNYRSHLQGRTAPEHPGIFFKPPSAVIGTSQAILLPPDSQEVHFEGELVVVMGRRARNVTPEEALDHVFGYTCGNDVSERVWQKNDLQWWRAKGSDTFAPVGPWIVTDLDRGQARLTSRLNGEVAQEAPISDLISDVPTIISFASRYATLEPGDLIYTGTPGSTRSMKEGDVVEVEISGIGKLSNPVARA